MGEYLAREMQKNSVGGRERWGEREGVRLDYKIWKSSKYQCTVERSELHCAYLHFNSFPFSCLFYVSPFFYVYFSPFKVSLSTPLLPVYCFLIILASRTSNRQRFSHLWRRGHRVQL